MTKTWIDAEHVTRTALTGGADDWFDAFWNRKPSTAGHGRIGQTARRLWARIADARIDRSVWRLHARKIGAATLAVIAPFGLAQHQTTVTIKD